MASVCYYVYILLWATVSALCMYYALLYLLIACSPHLYTIGANKWWWYCNYALSWSNAVVALLCNFWVLQYYWVLQLLMSSYLY